MRETHAKYVRVGRSGTFKSIKLHHDFEFIGTRTFKIEREVYHMILKSNSSNSQADLPVIILLL